MTKVSHSARETESIAIALAKSLLNGHCVAVDGELGAGKTQFVRGLVRGLGGDPLQVSSPTFVLLNIYQTAGPKLFHLDAYRARDEADFESIGFNELLEQRGIVVVEWASRVERLLPRQRVSVRIEPIGATRRRIEIIDVS